MIDFQINDTNENDHLFVGMRSEYQISVFDIHDRKRWLVEKLTVKSMMMRGEKESEKKENL
jgi:hypothetical protein